MPYSVFIGTLSPCRFTLFVNRRRDAFLQVLPVRQHHPRALSYAGCNKTFRIRKISQIEMRMCDYGPGCAREFRLDRRLLGDDCLANGNSQVELALQEEVFRDRRQHGS